MNTNTLGTQFQIYCAEKFHDFDKNGNENDGIWEYNEFRNALNGFLAENNYFLNLPAKFDQLHLFKAVYNNLQKFDNKAGISQEDVNVTENKFSNYLDETLFKDKDNIAQINGLAENLFNTANYYHIADVDNVFSGIEIFQEKFNFANDLNTYLENIPSKYHSIFFDGTDGTVYVQNNSKVARAAGNIVETNDYIFNLSNEPVIKTTTRFHEFSHEWYKELFDNEPDKLTPLKTIYKNFLTKNDSFLKELEEYQKIESELALLSEQHASVLSNTSINRELKLEQSFQLSEKMLEIQIQLDNFPDEFKEKYQKYLVLLKQGFELKNAAKNKAELFCEAIPFFIQNKEELQKLDSDLYVFAEKILKNE